MALDHGEGARGTREQAVPAGRSPAGLDRIRRGRPGSSCHSGNFPNTPSLKDQLQ